jgi:pyridinium-3,5-biscarboxylic acid mononucleotide synthase
MNIRTLLEKYSRGQLSIDEVQRHISIHSIERLGANLAQLDIDREIRKEVPEVIFAMGKENKDLLKIISASVNRNGEVVVSKVQKGFLPKLCNLLRKQKLVVEVGDKSSTILVTHRSFSNHKFYGPRGKVGILAAGTSDIGVAEEARLIVKAMGCDTILNYDIGIAGMHRLFPAIEEIISHNANSIVVVAGMEGALASLVSSIVNLPVIGVPTSVGYGFGSKGVAALASMLQSCTFGLAVVNIDNGIGGGAFAGLIANQIVRKEVSVPSKTKDNCRNFRRLAKEKKTLKRL